MAIPRFPQTAAIGLWILLTSQQKIMVERRWSTQICFPSPRIAEVGGILQVWERNIFPKHYYFFCPGPFALCICGHYLHANEIFEHLKRKYNFTTCISSRYLTILYPLLYLLFYIWTLLCPLPRLPTSSLIPFQDNQHYYTIIISKISTWSCHYSP